jgi:hypothetical protein
MVDEMTFIGKLMPFGEGASIPLLFGPSGTVDGRAVPNKNSAPCSRAPRLDYG